MKRNMAKSLTSHTRRSCSAHLIISNRRNAKLEEDIRSSNNNGEVFLDSFELLVYSLSVLKVGPHLLK